MIDNKTLYIIIVILLAIMIGGGIYWYLQNQNNYNQLISTNNIPITANGINSNKVTIHYLDYTDNSDSANTNLSWQDGNTKLSISKVYLVPDIADIGSWRDNYGIGKDNIFVVVETFVKDNRTVGDGTNVDTGKYLRVTDNIGKVSAPTDTSYLYLKPQENGTEFRVFVVSKDTKEITLSSGLVYKPQVTNVNFFGTDSKTFTGVFLYKKGLSDTYN